MLLTSVFCFLFTGIGGNSILKEDLKVIRTYQKEYKAVELARELMLTAEQVGILKAVKAEVDRIKLEHQSKMQDFEKSEAGFVKSVRKTYEEGAIPDDATQDHMKMLRVKAKRYRRELKLKIQLATLPLEDLLNASQKKKVVQLTRAKMGRNKRAKRIPMVQLKKRWGRILLSDEFVKAL